MQCDKKHFGTTSKGEEVWAYTLTNIKNHSVTVLNYGGIIQSLNVPDKNGNIENVVMGFNSVDEYERLSPFFGCITGRVAGRISGAAFEINGEKYALEANEGAVNLHGGPEGLDKRIWQVTEVVESDYAQLALSYTSPAMDQGFPGELDMVVTYKFDEEGALTLTYRATTDAPTVVTLTNHTYFNLSGDLSSEVLNHQLKIPADKVIAIGPDSVPVAVVDVEHTPFDFRIPKAIGQDIQADDENLRNGQGYDHPFVLNKEADETIELTEQTSGRKMTVTTSELCLVCYTGNLMEENYVYDKIPNKVRGAVCLETQYFPDSLNADFLQARILKPGEVYLEETTFKFSITEA